jgi:hypothetical protein
MGLVCFAFVACGDDSGGGGGDDAGTGTGGTVNPMSTGSGGSGTGGMTSTGTGGMTGTGGVVGTGGMIGLPMPMCDTSIAAETTCGGNTCTPPSGQAASFVCAITCCLPDNTCGTRRASMTNPTQCTPPAVLDPDCPDFTSMGMGGMTTYPGCCTPAGICGVRSTADMTCITSSPFLMGLMPGGPCDGGDAGVEDGG